MLLSMELCCARKKNTAKCVTLPIESVQCIDTIYYIYENICNNSQMMKTIQDKRFCRWHGKHLKYCQNLSTVSYPFTHIEKCMVLIELILVCSVNFI